MRANAVDGVCCTYVRYMTDYFSWIWSIVNRHSHSSSASVAMKDGSFSNLGRAKARPLFGDILIP